MWLKTACARVRKLLLQLSLRCHALGSAYILAFGVRCVGHQIVILKLGFLGDYLLLFLESQFGIYFHSGYQLSSEELKLDVNDKRTIHDGTGRQVACCNYGSIDAGKDSTPCIESVDVLLSEGPFLP